MYWTSVSTSGCGLPGCFELDVKACDACSLLSKGGLALEGMIDIDGGWASAFSLCSRQ